MMLEHLRTETRALHEALERRGPMARLLAPDLTLAEYGALLARLHGLYAPLEDRLARHADALPVPLAPRAPHLRADLAALGLTAHAADAPTDASEGVPPAAPGALPEVPDAAAALGVLYVLEGAALGGQVIARHVRRTLALTPAQGLAFFTGDADGTGARWVRFRDALAASPADPDAVAASARDTFSAFHTWL